MSEPPNAPTAGPPSAQPASRDRFASAWIPDVALVVGVALGLLVAPDVGSELERQRLVEYFSTSAQIIATFLVAIALFQGLPSAQAGYRVRRFLGRKTFVYVVVGEAAAIAGITHALPNGAYRYVFALTLGGGLGAFAAVVLAGVENIAGQREDAISAWLQSMRDEVAKLRAGRK